MKQLPQIAPSTGSYKSKEGSFRFRNWTLGSHQDSLLKKSDQSKIIDILYPILENCLSDIKDGKGNPISVKEMPLVLAEAAFLKIRSVSVNDTQDYYFKCDNESCDNEKLVMTADLKRFEIVYHDKYKDSLLINGYKIFIKLPTVQFLDLDFEKLDAANLEFIADNIEIVATEDEEWNFSEYPLEERLEFVRNLPPQFTISFVQAYNYLPKLVTPVEGKCSKCGAEHSKKIEGITGLFTV